MSKLVWDLDGTRNIQSGVSKVALFRANPNAKDSDTSAYLAGVAWSGVTAITENPGGADLTNLYADNIKYASMRAAENFGFTIEAYDYPDEWKECDGSKQAVSGVYLGQQGRAAFALVYVTQVGDDMHPSMDKGHKLHIIYNCTASPSSRAFATINENPDAISFSWEASATSTQVGDGSTYNAVCTIEIDSTKLDATGLTKLTALEETIFGTTDKDPTLPRPQGIIAAMT